MGSRHGRQPARHVPVLPRGVPGDEGATARQDRQHLVVAGMGRNAQPAALHDLESRRHRLYSRPGARSRRVRHHRERRHPRMTQSETQVQSSSANYLATRVAGRAIERVQVPADLVGAVMFLSSAASDFMTGQTINVDGGKAMYKDAAAIRNAANATVVAAYTKSH